MDGKVLRAFQKTYSEQRILKISAQLDEYFSKIVSQMQKNNSFWETNFELTENLIIKLQCLKI